MYDAVPVPDTGCCCSTVDSTLNVFLFYCRYDLTPTMREINKKISVRYYLNLVLVDEEDRRYFKQQVRMLSPF